MSFCVLIPAYKPDTELLTLVEKLRSFSLDILVVNDGSGEEYDELFAKVGEYASVISYDTNMGKGYALKKGFSEVRNYFPEAKGVITADADGQHDVTDICKVAALLETGASCVLSERQLEKNIPARSKFGNDLSRFVFAASTGKFLYDNQSGLRGFEISHCDWLVNVNGNKYDYEMGVLLHLDKRNVPVVVLPINTIYLNGNASSHFNPVKDTLRIYGRFIKTLLPSFISACLFLVITFIALFFVEQKYESFVILGSGFMAITSSLVFSKLFIFKKLDSTVLMRIIIFFLIRLILSVGFCFGMSLAGLPCAFAFLISQVLLLPFRYIVAYLLRKSEFTGSTMWLKK